MRSTHSRGKDTLMNALMGMDRLSTGVLPHTSVVTTLSYGEKERILVRCEGRPLAEEISFAALTNYVTESGNRENRRRVISADIQMPVEMLRRGLLFVDTPGVGSTVAGEHPNHDALSAGDRCCNLCYRI